MNQYEKEVMTMPRDRYGRCCRETRHRLVHTFAWAIPSMQAVMAIVGLNKPIIEIGAGAGYWAKLIKEAGGDIICFDNFEGQVGKHGQWHPVEKGSYEAIEDHQDRALMLCWPPYGEPLAFNCLATYTGDTLVYIGESIDGCTGDSDFHDWVCEEWNEDTSIAIQRHDGIYDGLTIYRRKTNDNV